MKESFDFGPCAQRLHLLLILHEALHKQVSWWFSDDPSAPLALLRKGALSRPLQCQGPGDFLGIVCLADPCPFAKGSPDVLAGCLSR